MTGRRKRVAGPEAQGLPPLAPEAAAALKAQVAQVAAALNSGQDLETLKKLVAPQPQDPAWDLHLLAALGNLAHPNLPPLLAALFGAVQDKTRRKALKKTLHLLKTRGVPVPAELLPRQEPRPLKPAPGPAPLAYAFPFFGNGERYLVLEGSKEILGGNLLVARLSDEKGFRECHLLSLNRRQRQEFWDHFRNEGLEEWATAPAAYVVRQLDEAYDLDPGGPGASRYGSLKERIYAHWGRPEAAPDPEHLLPNLSPTDGSRFLDQSRRLALDHLFLSWLPSMEEITPWLDKIKEVQDSPLVLSEQQQQVRLDGVVEEATAALYPPETRKYWRRRLWHLAYFLDLKGRPEDGRAAQAAAEALAESEKGPLTGENPFLKALVQHSLMLAWEFQKKGQEPQAAPGLLAPASESLIIRR